MLLDYHVHSNFSEDCNTPMEHSIESAIEKGITEICFTEHIDYDYPDPNFTFNLDLPRYDQKVKKMKSIYGDKIAIKKGVEIGVQPHILEHYEKLLSEESFDFIICSLHAVDKKNLHNGDFFKKRTPEEAYYYFYEELLYCVRNFNEYSVLGHLDLVKRYQKLDTDENFHEIIREIFNTIIHKGKGLEVNASGFAYGLGEAMPSEDILRLYKECGGEIITIGSDAHEARHVAHRFSEIFQLLEEIGFKYVASFTERKPEFHSINNFMMSKNQEK